MKIRNLVYYISFFIILIFILNKNNLRSLYLLLNSSYTDLYSLFNRPYSQINICSSLQDRLTNLVGKNNENIAITILDSNHNIIADINGNKLFIPASNQKLYSSAYALHKKGPLYRLETHIYKNSKGYYEITGSGDPDISIKHIRIFAEEIKSNRFLSYPSSSLILYEEPQKLWWPETWSIPDRKEDYGAPITRLALNGNAEDLAMQNPLFRFKSFSSSILLNNNINVDILTKSQQSFNQRLNRKLLLNIPSAPLYMLMNLANSESHNFSSEILLRNASNSWNNNIATKKLSKWVESIGVDKDQYNFADGSGLSRENKTTTRALSHVLAFMDKHRYSNYYISSMSIIGKRGTLRNQYDMNSSGITFHGKSGTLSDVRSLSGYLYTPSRKRIVSIIQNNNILDHNIFSNILSVVSSEDNCS